ncbi:MAG: long-chain fatty acid--CoA ligase [Candidatus Thorarchaeota archaeon]|nr:long-chain fatty acid--CoA ligase [Candidatus Thorarchaeota archaeon]
MDSENWSWIGDWAGRRAMLTPKREAVHDFIEGTRYSFEQMNHRANQMARVLLDLGVEKGDRVGVYSKNRFDYFDLFLGASKMGAILVPFNMRLSAREIEYLIGKTNPSVFIYDPQIQSGFNDFRGGLDGCPTLVMGSDARDSSPSTRQLMRKASSKDIERPRIAMDDPSLIVFTGGTTGLPKGATLSHRLVFWNSVNTIVSWGLNQEDIQPLLFPLFHTGGWNVLVVPFYHLGAKTILMGDFNPAETLQVIQEERCTIVVGVPTMLNMMAEDSLFAEANFNSVRVFISGGAPCPVAIMEKYWARGKILKMGYGLTEVGPNNFYLPESEVKRKPSSVGFPVFHCDMKIVDDKGTPISDGSVGELLLKGPHIFSGYWNEPEETRKTIEPDGWVHTGDLAVRDEEGFYSIVGRKKDMFISGGENVYPTEIEELLYQHPLILEAAVIGIPHEKWGEVGKAVIVLKPGRHLTGEEVRQYLEDKLAKYKIPKEYDFRAELPKSAAGKILKREL